MAENFSIKMETERFNRALRSFVRGAGNKADIGLKAIALKLLADIVVNWPVDTGRSRAAWHASMRGLGFKYDLMSTGKYYGKQPKAKDVSYGKSLGDYKEKLGSTNKYIDLINNVRYSIYLEYGYSKQAPSGVVRIAMRRITNRLAPEFLDRIGDEWHKHFD